MARTPDIAGAFEAIIARTLKSTLGSRLRKVDGRLKRLERRLKQATRGTPGRRAGTVVRRGRRRGPGRPRGRRSKR